MVIMWWGYNRNASLVGGESDTGGTELDKVKIEEAVSSHPGRHALVICLLFSSPRPLKNEPLNGKTKN